MSNRINSLEELQGMISKGGSRIAGNPLSPIKKSVPTETPKKSKYGNRKTVIEGIEFDSKKEAARWQELQLLQQAGEIKDLERQVEYSMDIREVHVCSFVADFRYYEKGKNEGVWVLIVEDVKSEPTRKNRAYRIKVKLLRGIYGLKVRET